MMDKKVTQRLVAAIQTLDQVAAQSEIDEVMDEIQAEPDVKVPEHVFREIFLPVFSGQLKEDKDFIAHWIGLVGSPVSSADVVDPQGNVLFKVPPIYETDRLSTERQGPRYESFLMEYSEQSKLHPALGQKIFVESSAEKLETAFADKTPNVQGWRTVFQYYGMIPTTGATPSEVVKRSVEDDFE